jgi:molybdopterin converting factor small subunit
MRIILSALCFLMVAAVGAAEKADSPATNEVAAGDSFTLPNAWTGSVIGATNGNPYLVDNKPRWRIDRLWPDTPLAGVDYIVMTWSGTNWVAKDNSYEGQPSVVVLDGVATLSARSAAERAPGGKIPVLIFIAPDAGTYRAEGSTLAKISPVGSAVTLTIFKLQTKTKVKHVSRVEMMAVGNNKQQDLKKLKIKMEAGDELAFVPQFSGLGVKADITLNNLKIIRTP